MLLTHTASHFSLHGTILAQSPALYLLWSCLQKVLITIFSNILDIFFLWLWSKTWHNKEKLHGHLSSLVAQLCGHKLFCKRFMRYWQNGIQPLRSCFQVLGKTSSCLQRLVTSKFHVAFQYMDIQGVPLYFLCTLFCL